MTSLVTALTSDPTTEGAGTYLHWGVVNISLTNLTIVLAMVVVFVLAIVLPFPQGREDDEQPRDLP